MEQLTAINNMIKIITFFVFATFLKISLADEMYLLCKTHPAEISNPTQEQFVEVSIKISTDNQMVYDPLFKVPVSFSTSSEVYSWKLRLREIKSEYPDLTLLATLNRYTGAYKVVMRGDKGDVPYGLGTCKRSEKAF